MRASVKFISWILCVAIASLASAEPANDRHETPSPPRERAARFVRESNPTSEMAASLRFFFQSTVDEQRARTYSRWVSAARYFHNGRGSGTIEGLAEDCITLMGRHPSLRLALAEARVLARRYEPQRGRDDGYRDEYYFYEVVRVCAHTLLRQSGASEDDLLNDEDTSPAEPIPTAYETRLITEIRLRSKRPAAEPTNGKTVP